MKCEIKVTKLSHGEIADFLSTALTGCDWIEIENDDDFYKEYDSIPEDKKEGQCLEDKIADLLLNGKTVRFLDYEEDEMYKLTYNKLLDACSTEEGYDYAKTLFVDEDGDYYIANNLLQLALFGEVVYG